MTTRASIGALLNCADYECDASTLHLRDRATQIDPTITPGADGFSGWKYGLWVLNYLQIMHDANERRSVAVAPADQSATWACPVTRSSARMQRREHRRGDVLGSSNIEGFQAQMFILEMDARADDWLSRLTTTDGVALSGFPSIASALAYNYASPLRWLPGQIAVTETDDGSGFPHARVRARVRQ